MSKNSRKSRPVDSPLARFQLRIRSSRIHRLGVFATEAIPPRKCVIEYGGRLIRARDAVRELRKPGRPKRILMVRLKRGWIIDAIARGTGAEYINHSCDPNLFLRRTPGHVCLLSRRRIEKGEELTMDYKLRPKKPPLACRCESARCRGFMNHP